MSVNIENQSNHSAANTGILLAIFVTISFVLGWWGFCWYTSHSFFGFGKAQHLAVLFKSSGGLNEDANVFMDGVKIGSVEKIEWLGVQEVLVHLRVTNTKTKLSRSAKFCILTNGLIGAKYIEVIMPSQALAAEQGEQIIDENTVLLGEQPVRTELAMAKLVNLVNDFDSSQFESQWRNDRRIFLHAADRFSTLADKTIPLAEKAVPLENEAMILSKGLSKTIKRLNNFLGNEHLSADLKETAQKAKETAENIQSAVHELNITFTDKQLREDIISAFSNLNEATLHIENSMDVLQETANNKALRSDIKQILADARQSMDKLDEITSKPGLGSDFKLTLERTQDAMDHLNLAAQQISQILDKRHPLIHMFIGRPGHVETVEPQK